MTEPEHVRATYNDIHNIIKTSAERISAEFKPDLLIAIGWCCVFDLLSIDYHCCRRRVGFFTSLPEMRHECCDCFDQWLLPCSSTSEFRVQLVADSTATLRFEIRLLTCECAANFLEGSLDEEKHPDSSDRSLAIRIFARYNRRKDWKRSCPHPVAVRSILIQPYRVSIGTITVAQAQAKPFSVVKFSLS